MLYAVITVLAEVQRQRVSLGWVGAGREVLGRACLQITQQLGDPSANAGGPLSLLLYLVSPCGCLSQFISYNFV